jgi:hypothetical protein
MAIPDQGEAKTAWLPPSVEADMRIEQLDLHPIRPQHAPGRPSHAREEELLQCALGRQLGAQRLLERLKLRHVLVGEQHELLRPQAVLQRVLR